jgi:hypothetical protein
MRKLILAILAVGVVSFGIGIYFWTKPVADLESATADVSVTAAKLMNDFENDEKGANETYLDKVVEVSGTVSEVKASETGATVVLETESMMGGVTCGFKEGVISIEDLSQKVGSTIKVKGQCTGYLMDVILERCVLVN